MDNTESEKDFLYKILMVGDANVGKTSIIKKYVHGIFSQNHKPTIGVDFALKVLKLDNNLIVRLQIWDIAGQERFNTMTRVYYKEAFAAFVVFDASSWDNPNTLNIVKKWKSDIDSKVSLPNSDESIPVILLANKIDLISTDNDKMKKLTEEMNQFCTSHGFSAWFGVSAKENINLNLAHETLIDLIFKKLDQINQLKGVDNDNINANKNLDKQTNTIDLNFNMENLKTTCCD